MSANFLFSLIPIASVEEQSPKSEPTVSLNRVVRVGGKGSEWNSPACKEINAICEELGLTGIQICTELEAFDGIPISRESLQSYKQGNVLGQEPYEVLLKRLRPYLKMRRAKYGSLMKADAITIIEGWMKSLNVDIKQSDRSPWKEFTTKIGPVKRDGKTVTIDHTTIFRWYQSNKKPASINDLIWYDDAVKVAATKLKSRAT